MTAPQARARRRIEPLLTVRAADSRLRRAIARVLVFALVWPQIAAVGASTGVEAHSTIDTTAHTPPPITCRLYPIALNVGSLTGVPVGGVVNDIFNGTGPGNFGWLTWAGSPSVPTLVRSLTPPGDSETYVNSADPADHEVSVADWVRGKPGVSNSSNVRNALDALMAEEIIVPVWDQAQGNGDGASYRVSAFAQVRLLGYQLPAQNRISVRFLGFTSCQAPVNKAPIVDAGPDQTVTLPANAQLHGTVTDDGLPAGGMLTVAWSKVSGPGTVTFANPKASATAATFSAPGTYVLRLTASDSQLTSSDTVTITVRPANAPPAVDAGPDQTITLPADAQLNGIATDDGLPAGGTLSVSWSKVSGPGTVIFANPNARATSATFSAPGTYMLKLTASDSQLTSSDTVAITVRQANQAPVVNAGPDQTVSLPDIPPVTAPLLKPLLTGLNNPIGIDYHQPTNTVVISVNHPSGVPYNLELVAADGTRSPYSGIGGFTDELNIATARDEGAGMSRGGFKAGELFTGTGVPGVIARISPDGSIMNPWVMLPGEDGLIAGSLYVDRTNVFGGDVIAVTTTGGVWRIKASGVARELTRLGTRLEGVQTIPADPKYGPWAGKILVGAKDQAKLYTVDSFGTSNSFDIGIRPEDIDVISANENFFGVDPGSQTLWGAPAAAFASRVGDILITQASPGLLWSVRWAGSAFQKTLIGTATRWAQVTFAPAGINAVAPAGVTVNLNGLAADDGLPQGSTLNVMWTRARGPDTVFFHDATHAATTATFTGPGTYVLRLTASDGELAAFDEATIVVEPGNNAPAVNAGPDQTITETDMATLTGSVTDDGLPAGSTLTIEWRQVSGPGTTVFGDATHAATTAIFTAAGIHVLRLSASDTQFTSSDDVVVTVNATPNGPPHITSIPITEFTLSTAAGNGEAVDLGPWTVQDYESPLLPAANWTKDATNTGVTQTLSARPSILFSDFNLSNARMQGTLSVDTSTGDGFVGFVFGYQDSGHFYLFDWKKADQSDPLGMAGRGMSVKVFTADSPLTAADFWSTAGNGGRVRTIYHNTVSWRDSTDYRFTLQFRPGEIEITVREGATIVGAITLNDPTFVNGRVGFYTHSQEHVRFRGFDRISMLQGTYTYDVEATDPNSDTLTYSLDARPLGMSIASRTGLITWPVTAKDAGAHEVTVRVQDPGGLFDVQHYTLTILNPNQPPFVDAGPDLTVELPHTAALNGIATDDGLPSGTLNVEWTQVSGPGTATFADSTKAATTVSFDQTGTYILRITATDTLLTSTDDVLITVEPENHAPSVNAGAAQTIQLPDMANLNGIVTDDGLPAGSTLLISWSVVSGPGPVTFGDAGKAVTTATFGAPGTYVLRLSASDSRLSGSDEVTVIVAPANEGPSVNAGADLTVTFPNGADLHGTVTDDGLPAASTLSISWESIGGPGAVAFTSPHAATTNATFSAAGTYLVRLTASDSQLTSSDDVTVIVEAANHPPTVNAGSDQSITLPNAANLNGTVSDDGRPARAVVVTSWTAVSGPGTVTFGNSSATMTTAGFSERGTYVLRLTASDSDLTGSDDVTIAVGMVNQAPTVAAGADQTVTLPAKASLNGTVTDDGLPTGSTRTTWSQVSGPGTVAFGDPNATVTNAGFSAAGTYVLRLSATDSQLIVSDELIIQVRTPVVDLAVGGVDTGAVVTDPSTLVVSGAVQVNIQNKGTDTVNSSFEVLVFGDTNGNGTYQSGVDTQLGVEVFAGSIAANGAAPLLVPVSGIVSFGGNAVYVFVDSARQVAELDETNNIASSSVGIKYQPSPGAFAPKVKWQYNSTRNTSGVSEAPVVAPLIDTNGDGVVNENDVPAIIFLDGGNFQGADPHLMAIRGDDRTVIFDRPSTYNEYGVGTNLAVGDLAGDGKREVIVAECCRGVIHVINSDGTERWQSPVVTYRSSPVIADLDGDGRAEILYGCTIFNFDGTVRRLNCTPPNNVPTVYGGATQMAASSLVADPDRDGKLDIIRGPGLFDKDGNPKWFWQSTGSFPFTLRGTFVTPTGTTTVNIPSSPFFLSDAFTAVANLDDDPNAEIVAVGSATIGASGICGDILIVFEHTGQMKPGFPKCLYQDYPNFIGGDSYAVGPPTIVNIDDDPQPEIIIPATKSVSGLVNGSEVSRYMIDAYKSDGSLKWHLDLLAGQPVYGPPPVAAFDFDGDGKAELVYRDEQILYIINGSDGTIRHQVGVGGNGLSTAYPVIADVDNDGIADIVVPAANLLDGSPLRRGIVVLSDTEGNWRNSRRVWNQWLYYVTHVNEDASIPRVPRNNWEFFNNSRTQTSIDGLDPLAAPDLVLSRFTIDSGSCQQASAGFTVRVGNGGSLRVGAGQRVNFYSGATAGGPFLGAAHTTRGLAPGEFEDVTLTKAAPFPSQVFAIVGERRTTAPVPSSNLASLPHTWAQASGYCKGCTFVANISAYRGIDGSNNTVWFENPFRPGDVITVGSPFYEVRFPFPVNVTAITIQNNLTGVFRNSGFLTGTLTASNGFSMPVTLDPVGQGTFTLPAEQQNVSWVRLTGLSVRPDGPSLSEFIVAGSYVEPQFLVNEGGGGLANNTLVSSPDLAVCDPSHEHAPFFKSAPPTTAYVDAPFTYQPEGGDINNDPLTFSLLTFPNGMTIGGGGLIAWTPSSNQLGTHAVTVQVSDGRGATAEQSFSLRVRPPNQAPEVNAGPDQTITLNKPAILNATAHDDGLPAGSPLTASWTKVSGPGTVTFGSSTAVATTATFGAEGTYLLRLTATDSRFTISDDVSITVSPIPPNQPPVVDAGPDQAVTLPNKLALFTKVTDDDLPAGGTITSAWSQVSGPGTVTFTPGLANVVTASFSAPGVYVLRLTASDSQLTASDDVATNVIGAPVNHAPTIDAGADLAINLPDSASLSGVVSDDGLPVNGTITTLWSQVSGPAAVIFGNATQAATTATFTVAGTYVLRLSASDSALAASDDISTEVFDPITSPPPDVSINSPADGSEIRSKVDFVGSISSGSWRLEYSLNSDGGSNNQTWTVIGSGSSPVTNGLLGTFDPTLLLNGVYGIRLISRDNSGQTSVLERSAVVIGDQKVGNFSLSFIDLDVPVAGIPIQVIRSYDSRDKRTGDFGVGWTLGIKNVRVEKSGKLGKNWEQTRSGGFFPSYCLQQSRAQTVTITFGDGKVFTFQPVATPQCRPLTPIQFATIGFRQVPGSTGTMGAKLESLSGIDVIVSGSVPGPAELLDLETFTHFNPTVFRLTTADGYVYVIDQQAGVRSMTHPNGNTLTLNASGIIHSSGKSITFTRDAQGRITEIKDPADHSSKYVYDANGDLVRVTDRESNATSITYNSSHGLLTITDPRGIQPIRNEYDSNGRLVRHVDALGKEINYTHDFDAHQEIVTDRLGNITVHEYDASGNIVKTTDAEGGVTKSTYDARGNVLSVTNAIGKTTTYAYDALDSKTSETDPLGNTIHYTYNSRRQVLTMTDARGAVTTNTYESNGNLLSSKDELGNVTRYTYSGNGLQTSMTDALGNVTRYEYDSAGNRTKETDPLRNVTTYTYDGNGNQLSNTMTRTTRSGAAETLVTAFHYDHLDRLVKTTYPDGSSTEVTYNTVGKESATKDQLGREIAYEYDGMGRRIRTTSPDGTRKESTYDAEGRRLTGTDRAGRQTRYRYDKLGRLLETLFPDNTKTTSTYDAIGRETTRTDGRGNTTIYAYDANCECTGRPSKITDALGNVTTFTYDANHNRLTMTDAAGNTIRYEYDANNRRTAVMYPDGTAATSTYDALGRTTASTDQAGMVSLFEYDELGRLVKGTDALGQVTTYTYDEVGNRLSQTDANNHTTRFEYDKVNHRVRRELPLGMAESYAHDAAGNLISRTDFRGKTTTYVYDTMNRLLLRTPDASLNQPAVMFSHTATGQRASMTDASGTTSYTYDSRDRLTTKATPQGTLGYTYDASGNLLSVASSNANGTSVHYVYDTLNRLSTVTDDRLATGTTNYTYDAVGNLASLVYPNGVQSTYTYNSLNRLTDLSVAKTNTLISYSYTLGAAGNRLSVTELSGRRVNYRYDALYRLTNETISGDVIGVNNGAVDYIYDPVGNRLSRSSSLGSVPSSNYSYDQNDRLTSNTYDANGNTTASDGSTYTYDSENRLTDANGSAIHIVYDGDGNRVAKTVGGVTTRYLIDANNLTGHAQVVEEIAGGSVQRAYTYGLDLVSQRQLLGGNWFTSFYGYDGHGSIRLLTDSTGNVTDTYTYDAFGNLIARTGTTPNDYLYTGEQFDPNIGFYYLRARYMNPETGRFLTMDTFEGSVFEPASLHKYLYAHNDPVDNSDPSGRSVTLVEVQIALTIVSILASIAQTIWCPGGQHPGICTTAKAVGWASLALSFVLGGASLFAARAGLNAAARGTMLAVNFGRGAGAAGGIRGASFAASEAVQFESRLMEVVIKGLKMFNPGTSLSFDLLAMRGLMLREGPEMAAEVYGLSMEMLHGVGGSLIAGETRVAFIALCMAARIALHGMGTNALLIPSCS